MIATGLASARLVEAGAGAAFSSQDQVPLLNDQALAALAAGVLVLLACGSVGGRLVARRATTSAGRAIAENVRARVRAWWVMAGLFVIAVSTGPAIAIALFALTSWLALREFVRLAPTRAGDRAALVWAFFIVTPLQYLLIWMQWYGLFSVLVPVYVAVFVATRAALAGDTERFLERSAVTQWGVTICIYFVSHVPALLMLRVPGDEQGAPRLVFFLVLVVQASDVLQYVWGRALGQRPMAPAVSPNKTWEGFVGGIAGATALGAAIWWATPFSPAAAALMALIVTVTGVAGGLVMSAIKRDRGVKDYGTLIAGHGGVLDRIDSLCFAAPVFFHLTRYFYVP